MYFLYLDESGDPKNRTDKVFVLARVALFERQTHWATRDLAGIVSTNFVQRRHPKELHAEAIRSARGFWRRVAPDLRPQVMADTYHAIATTHHLTAVGAGVDLDSYPDQPMELAFEQPGSAGGRRAGAGPGVRREGRKHLDQALPASASVGGGERRPRHRPMPTTGSP